MKSSANATDGICINPVPETTHQTVIRMHNGRMPITFEYNNLKNWVDKIDPVIE
jgi:hypothetical protein